MAKKATRQSKIVLAVSFMFALSVMAPAALAEKGDGDSQPRVAVLEAVANGNVVEVLVKNFSSESLTVFVEVDAVVGEMKQKGMTPVTVFAGSTANTVVGFTAPVSSVEGSGIIDDGGPL